MLWETVTGKNAQGNIVSIRGQASDVILSDGRDVAAVLTAIASQVAALNSNIQTLAAKIDSISGEGA